MGLYTSMGLTEEESFILEWKRNQLGGFSTKLIDTIFAADCRNREKLSKVFPVEVSAIEKYMHNIKWLEKFEEKIGKL